MYRYWKVVHVVVFLIIVGIAFGVEYNPFIINDAKSFSQNITNVTKMEDGLLKEIEQKSKSYNEDPQDAYIDRVWKKTPGRDGVEINVEASYKKMKKDSEFNESLLVYDSISPKVSLHDLPPSPIFRGHPEKEMVSLLINVSWGTEHIPDILNILKEHQVKATFFIEGKWARENTNLVKMIDEQNHIIGNHAYNHPDMSRLSKNEITKQIEQTNNIIKAIIEKEIKWFAPPSGSFSDLVVETAHHLQMETILWTTDTIDWKNPSVSVMMNRVINNIHPGATILMHPTPSVVQGLSPMIKGIKNKGYKIGTIEQLLSEER